MTEASASTTRPSGQPHPEGPHGGQHALDAARAWGVDLLWTLSGAHVFPLYDAAVTATPPVRILDVRHEQTAVFGAEATAKLTRRPGLATVTAGPGVTNAVSAVTTAYFNGSPVVVVGGRAPGFRWGAGSLQELDHPPILAPVTKGAYTIHQVEDLAAGMAAAFRTASSPHRGPVFVDVPMDQLYSRLPEQQPPPGSAPTTPPTIVRTQPDPDDLAAIATLLERAERPVVVLGSDVWTDGAEHAARTLVEEAGLPALGNGMGRGVLPAGHPLLFHRARGVALKGADLVVVIGTPLDFRLSFGDFGGAAVVHVADAPEQVARHVALAASASGSLTSTCEGILASLRSLPRTGPWLETLAGAETAASEKEHELLYSDADPIHPARVYGELRRVLAPDAVVVCDGGDFVSYAGRFVEPGAAGCWLDPGPFGCLGTGMGYAAAARLARPDSQVVVLLGDGAAGFSLMDVDTLVRHRLPVVIVVGNNGGWGLERHPMQFLYGYHVAAELQPQARYDEVVRALGGAGELVTRPGDIAAALRRGFESGVPYLVNVALDPEVAYPRSTVLA